MQYAIRLARETDLTSMYEVSQMVHSSAYYDEFIPTGFRERYDSYYQKTDAHQQSFVTKMARRLIDPSWELWVATDKQGAIIGYTLSQQVLPTKRLLKGLFVIPAKHGNGIGGALLRRVLTSMPIGCTMEFVVIAANAVAKRLYQKHGFEVCGPAKNSFYGAPQDVMQRVID